jgi:hypothetical protein
MTMQETDPQGRLGDPAPVRFSARPATNGTQPNQPRGGLDALRSVEFIVFAVGSVGVLIAAAIDDGFDAQHAWTLVAVLAAAFILTRR